MEDDSLLLRTHIQDRRKPPCSGRGSRYWGCAEIRSNAIFIVQATAIEPTGAVSNTRRFITADFEEVLGICHDLSDAHVQLMIYVDPPAKRRIFGRVIAVLGKAGRGRPLMIQLESGDHHVLSCTRNAECVDLRTRLFPVGGEIADIDESKSGLGPHSGS